MLCLVVDQDIVQERGLESYMASVDPEEFSKFMDGIDDEANEQASVSITEKLVLNITSNDVFEVEKPKASFSM